MRPSVDQLEAFYASPLGEHASQLLVKRIRALWPDIDRRRVLGLGYPLPFLDPRAHEGPVVLMSGPQGAAPWPIGEANRVAIGRGHDLPFPDGAFDRVLMVHSLEVSQDKDRLMREVWRVTEDGGRLLVIAPNRRGTWSWSDHSPFGHGQPFSPAQLEATLAHALFEPRCVESALFAPPSVVRMTPSGASLIEHPGVRFLGGVAGALIADAEKTIYAGASAATARIGRAQRGYAALAGAPRAAALNGRSHSDRTASSDRAR